jgi:hypothetical protein
MDQSSVAKALHVSPQLPFELTWPNQFNLEISLSESLEFGETYEFRIDRQALDNSGVSLTEPYEWTYQLKDTISRQVIPEGSRPLTVYFNYEMADSQSLDGLELEPAIDGEWAWNEDRTAVYFLPEDRYPPQTTYTLSFNTSLVASSGQQLPAIDPFVFTIPHPITWARPNSNNISPTNRISIRFDRPMDAASTEAAFSISPDVEGSFSWSETTLFFRPDGDYLGENTEYEVTIAPSALDIDGEKILDEAYTWHFQTGGLPNTASFGIGPNAQVLDASGRRAIQYVLSQNRTLTIELYALSLEQFLDRYASGFKGTAGWEFNPISTANTELAYSWELEPENLPKEYNRVREVIIPAAVPPGLYLLNLNAGRLDDQLILLLTNNTITVKQAEGQIMAWVTDINGRPVPGIEVGVYSRDGQLLLRDTADGRGIFRGRIADFEAGGPPSIDPLVVVAQDGNDITASGLTPEWRVYTGSYWSWWQPATNVPDYAAYIYTDRPIYRPGQTVFFKAILRTDQDAILNVPPAGTPATVRIRDARNNVEDGVLIGA